MSGSRVWGMVVGALAAAGCADGPTREEQARRLSEIDRQGEELTQAADSLEERMLADQANLLLWQELARRHQHVSALAVRNQSDHFSRMVELMEQQAEKARRLKRPRVAEAGEDSGEEPARASRARPILSRASAPGASRARN